MATVEYNPVGRMGRALGIIKGTVKKEIVEKCRQQQDLAQTRHEAILGQVPNQLLPVESIRALLEEHRRDVPKETSYFFGCDDMDQLLKQVAAIKDDEKRKKAFERMKSAKLAAQSRRSRMAKLLEPLSSSSEESLAIAYSPTEVKALIQAKQLTPSITDHIPNDYLLAQEGFDHVQDRMDTLSLSSEEKLKKKEELAQLVASDSGPRKDERETFRSIIEPLGVKDFDRVDSFFDPLLASPSLEDQKRLKTVLDAAIKRAHAVCDCGGSMLEVEAQLQHLPRTWWPPQFVQEMQAWRRVERELQEERLKKLEDPSESKKEKIQSMIGLMSNVLTMGTLNKPSEHSTDYAKPIGIVDGLATALTGLSNIIDEGVELSSLVEKLQSKPPVVLEGKLKTAADHLSRLLDLSAEAVELVGDLSKHLSDQLSSTVGAFGIVTGARDIIKAAHALYEHGALKKGALALLERAELQRTCRERDDGGVMENCLRNEQLAQERQMKEDRFNMVKSGIAVATSATYAAPVATMSLKIVGTAMTYAGKIYFANIDFNYAQQAKQTLEKARGGDPVARLRIFQDSGTYAKMYIALLAQDGDPLATEFVVKRGYTESDLDRPEVSTMILRDFLMSAAGQQKELETTDSRSEAIASGVLGDKVVEFVSQAVDRAGQFFSDVGKDRTITYDAKWTHDPAHVKLTLEAWRTTWRSAMGAGLYIEDAGVEPALKMAEQSLATLGAFQLTVLEQIAEDKVKRAPMLERGNLVVAYRSLTALYQALGNYQPLHNPPGGDRKKMNVHVGMTRYVSAMMTEAKTIQIFIDQKMQEKGWLDTPRSLGYQFPVEKALSSADWTKHANAALEQAWLGMVPAGQVIAGKLKAAVTAGGSRNLESKDAQVAREARITYKAALDGLMEALNGYWRVCEHPGLREYMDQYKALTATELRKLDKTLYPSLVDWNPEANKQPPESRFTFLMWNMTYREGMESGFISEDLRGGKLGKALQVWEAADKKLNGLLEDRDKFILARNADPKEVQKQSYAVLLALKEIYLTAGEYSISVDTPGLSDYLVFICMEAQRQSMALSEVGKKITFKYVPWELTSLTKDQWDVVCRVAINAGAVAEDAKKQKALGSALDKWQEKVRLYEVTVKREAKRALIDELTKLTQEALVALSDMSGALGFSDNDLMQKCLVDMRSLLAGYLQSKPVQDILQGVGAQFPSYGGDVWAYREWTDKLKVTALEQGLLAPKQQTGLGEALNNADQKFRDFKTLAKSSSPDISHLFTYKKDARVALNKLLQIAGGLTSVPNTNFKSYIGRIVEAANQRQEELLKMPDGEFKPEPFQWTDASWQEVKKKAIWAGAMESKISTGFGKAVETAKSLYEEFVKARNPQERVKVQLKCVKAFSDLREKATDFKQASNNSAFQRYMQQCLNELSVMEKALGPEL